MFKEIEAFAKENNYPISYEEFKGKPYCLIELPNKLTYCIAKAVTQDLLAIDSIDKKDDFVDAINGNKANYVQDQKSAIKFMEVFSNLEIERS